MTRLLRMDPLLQRCDISHEFFLSQGILSFALELLWSHKGFDTRDGRGHVAVHRRGTGLVCFDVHCIYGGYSFTVAPASGELVPHPLADHCVFFPNVFSLCLIFLRLFLCYAALLTLC